jgi:hypothetical protein
MVYNNLFQLDCIFFNVSLYPHLDFTGPNFSWPSKLNIYDRCEIFDYIIDPRWEVEEEMANNTIVYYHFIEARAFDSSKGTHVLIINGQIKDYYISCIEKKVMMKMIKY